MAPLLAAVPALVALLALLPAPARAIAVPADNVTLSTRACQPPHDTYPFCNPSLPLDERIADLVSRLDDAEIPALLTARHNESGQSPASGAIPRLGLPEYDWGMNAVRPSARLSSLDLVGGFRPAERAAFRPLYIAFPYRAAGARRAEQLPL